MANALLARLDKLETRLPPPEKPRRLIQITANQGDEDEAQRLLESEGDNPDDKDLVIMRVIVPVPDQTLKPRPPRITVCQYT